MIFTELTILIIILQKKRQKKRPAVRRSCPSGNRTSTGGRG